MKKLKYLFLLFLLLLITDVNASTINGSQADSPTYAYVNSNYNNASVRLWTTNLFGTDIVDYGSVVNDYVYVTACTDMPTLGYSYSPFYNNTTGHTASASDIRYSANLSSKTCTFSNGTQGKVAYIKFRLISDLLNVPVSGNNTYLYNDYITLNIGTSQPFSFSIQNISALDTDLDIYSNDFDASLFEQQNQEIINNQNENTNTLNDSLNSMCKDTTLDINTDLVSENGKYLDPNGSLITYGSAYVSKYIKLKPNSTYTIKRITGGSQPSNVSYCLYNANKAKYQCSNMPGENSSITFTANNYSSYLRVSFIGYRAVQVVGPICNDWEAEGQQDIINSQKETTDAINGLNDSITSEQNPNTNQDINDMNDMVASDTPISDLITMPLTLINAYINGVNSSCSPINLGNLYGTDLVLPCINLEQRLGSNLWYIIDAFFSIFMCYNIGMLFITAFDGITSLRDDFEGLYQPRHADTGYQPKHGG